MVGCIANKAYNMDKRLVEVEKETKAICEHVKDREAKIIGCKDD